MNKENGHTTSNLTTAGEQQVLEMENTDEYGH